MTRRANQRRRRSNPRQVPAMPGKIGMFGKPPKDPPTIVEQKWRRATLKVNVAAAGDSGAIEIFTGARIQETLLAQQRIPAPTSGEKMVFMTHKIMSYALPGVADSGQQVYPSTKIRAYPLNGLDQLALSYAQDQKEDSGTLEEPARLSYVWPAWQQQCSQFTSSTDAFAVIENYHCARGYVYLYVSFCYADE